MTYCKKSVRKLTEGVTRSVYRDMNIAGMNTTGTFDWSGHIRLGVILTIATALAAYVLGGHVDQTTFIIAVFVISSIVSWNRIPRITSDRCVNAFHEPHHFRRGYCRREQVTLHRVTAHRA